MLICKRVLCLEPHLNILTIRIIFSDNQRKFSMVMTEVVSFMRCDHSIAVI